MSCKYEWSYLLMYLGHTKLISIGVGRCSDLGGGDIFFNNKNVISLRNNAYMQYGLQYCNEVHYVNSG